MNKTENNSVDGTMEKLLDRLITVIGDEAVLFEKFLKLLEHQQDIIIKNKVDDLSEVTSQIQKIVMESKKLEDNRAGIVEQIRQDGCAETNLTVSKICEMADSGRSNQLSCLRETVLDLYTRIEETRMKNGLLIRQSLEQIHNTMEVIGRIPAQKEIYQGKGDLRREYVPIGVDRRI